MKLCKLFWLVTCFLWNYDTSRATEQWNYVSFNWIYDWLVVFYKPLSNKYTVFWFSYLLNVIYRFHYHLWHCCFGCRTYKSVPSSKNGLTISSSTDISDFTSLEKDCWTEGYCSLWQRDVPFGNNFSNTSIILVSYGIQIQLYIKVCEIQMCREWYCLLWIM